MLEIRCGDEVCCPRGDQRRTRDRRVTTSERHSYSIPYATLDIRPCRMAIHPRYYAGSCTVAYIRPSTTPLGGGSCYETTFPSVSAVRRVDRGASRSTTR